MSMEKSAVALLRQLTFEDISPGFVMLWPRISRKGVVDDLRVQRLRLICYGFLGRGYCCVSWGLCMLERESPQYLVEPSRRHVDLVDTTKIAVRRAM